MENTSCEDLARELLGYCLRGEKWPPELLRCLITRSDCAGAFFRIVVEGLSDLFEPGLCETYANLFAQALAYVLPEVDPEALVARYYRVRRPRPFAEAPQAIRKIIVLSRVTLGADVAITSVILNAVKRRFPETEIVLAGTQKCWELFAADSRIRHLFVPFVRNGTLRERLAPWFALKDALSGKDTIVIDPDSRLTQLGLLPVCPEENYYFFESRAYGGKGDEPLPALTQRWVREALDVEGAAPYIAPASSAEISNRPLVAMSFGVGDNPAKRIGGPFEQELLKAVLARGAFVWIDKGEGGDEAARVERAIASLGTKAERVRTWEGSFAGFAAIIARSDMYVGYDSAGQHVAAACGIPLVSVFAGFPSPRMLARWRPTGPGKVEVVRVDAPDPASVLQQTLRALDQLG